MKLHQNGTVFLIRLRATMAWIKQRTAACDELSRVEYRLSNDEGWNRFAKSFLKQTEYISNASVVGKNRCQYAAQMFHFFFSHFVFLLSEV